MYWKCIDRIRADILNSALKPTLCDCTYNSLLQRLSTILGPGGYVDLLAALFRSFRSVIVSQILGEYQCVPANTSATIYFVPTTTYQFQPRQKMLKGCGACFGVGYCKLFNAQSTSTVRVSGGFTKALLHYRDMVWALFIGSRFRLFRNSMLNAVAHLVDLQQVIHAHRLCRGAVLSHSCIVCGRSSYDDYFSVPLRRWPCVAGYHMTFQADTVRTQLDTVLTSDLSRPSRMQPSRHCLTSC